MVRQRQSYSRIVAVALVAIFLSSCAAFINVGPRRPTEFKNDLTSACLDSRSSYKAYENACIIKKNCPAAQDKEARSLSNQANQLCATKNEANKAKVQAIVIKQEALGR